MEIQNIDLLFYVLAGVSFLLKAFNVQAKVDFFALAFFFLTLSLIF